MSKPVPTYSDACERYGVRPGDVWQVGDHLLAHGDLENDSHVELATLAGRLPDDVVTDPPWDPLAAGRYRTVAFQGDPDRPVTYTNLIAKLLDACQLSRGAVWIDYGTQGMLIDSTGTPTWMNKNRGAPWLEKQIAAAGGRHISTHPAHYNGGKDSVFIEATWDPDYRGIGPIPLMEEIEATHWIVANRTTPGGLILDPCLGQGLTAVACQQAGRSCLGLELNVRRLAVTIDKLANLGLDANRVGHLTTAPPTPTAPTEGIR